MQPKPDDIPQDIWDLAESHRKPWVQSGRSIKEYVARALMAERERCLNHAEKHLTDTTNLLSNPPRSSAAWNILQAIRSGR